MPGIAVALRTLFTVSRVSISKILSLIDKLTIAVFSSNGYFIFYFLCKNVFYASRYELNTMHVRDNHQVLLCLY